MFHRYNRCTKFIKTIDNLEDLISLIIIQIFNYITLMKIVIVC